MYTVEHIRKHRCDKKGNVQYFVKWQDYPESDNTWEPEGLCVYVRHSLPSVTVLLVWITGAKICYCLSAENLANNITLQEYLTSKQMAGELLEGLSTLVGR